MYVASPRITTSSPPTARTMGAAQVFDMFTFASDVSVALSIADLSRVLYNVKHTCPAVKTEGSRLRPADR
jgi:hypothetical protein